MLSFGAGVSVGVEVSVDVSVWVSVCVAVSVVVWVPVSLPVSVGELSAVDVVSPVPLVVGFSLVVGPVPVGEGVVPIHPLMTTNALSKRRTKIREVFLIPAPPTQTWGKKRN